jgi:hypothetical protein
MGLDRLAVFEQRSGGRSTYLVEEGPLMTIRRVIVDHVALMVRDLDVSKRFYQTPIDRRLSGCRISSGR